MMWKRSGGRWPLVLALGLLALPAPAVWAGDCEPCEGEAPPCNKFQLFIRKFRGDLYYGRNNRPHSFQQSGYANEISRFARPSDNCNYGGYYVGGGAVRGGSGPGPRQGSWGWDYLSIGRFRYLVELGWNDRYQAGYGRYKIDGPPVEDIGPVINDVRDKLREGRGEKGGEKGGEGHE